MKFEFFDINIYHKPFAWNSLLKFPFSFLLFRKAKCFQLTRIFATEAQIDFQATLSRLLVETKAALYLAKRGLSAGRGRKGNMWATCLNGKHVSKSSLSRPHMWVLTMTHFPPSSPSAATQAEKLPKLFNLFKRASILQLLFTTCRNNPCQIEYKRFPGPTIFKRHSCEGNTYYL